MAFRLINPALGADNKANLGQVTVGEKIALIFDTDEDDVFVATVAAAVIGAAPDAAEFRPDADGKINVTATVQAEGNGLMELYVQPMTSGHDPCTVIWEGVAAVSAPVPVVEPVTPDSDPKPSEEDEVNAQVTEALAQEPVLANPPDEDAAEEEDNDDNDRSGRRRRGPPAEKSGWRKWVNIKTLVGGGGCLVIMVLCLIILAISVTWYFSTRSESDQVKYYDTTSTEQGSDQPPVVDVDVTESNSGSQTEDNWMSELDIPSDWNAEYRDDRVCVTLSKIEQIQEQGDIPYIVHINGCMSRPALIAVLKRLNRYP
jgi:hypothetical protein